MEIYEMRFLRIRHGKSIIMMTVDTSLLATVSRIFVLPRY
jgi:hypothetical protein